MRKHRNKTLEALIFSGLLFSSFVSTGQESDSTLRKIDLESITVNALSLPVNQFELPGAVSSISSKRLRITDQSIITSEINTTPGVFMHSGALNTNRITIRGVGSRTPFATNKIRAFYGLMPLTDGGGETTIEDIDLSLIESVEIQKGPNASLYGAGLGGVILLNPARSENQAFLRTGIGSFGLRRWVVGINISKDDTDLSLNISKQKSDGFRQNNEVNRENFFLRWRKNQERSSFGLLALHTNQKAFIPSSLGITDFTEAPEKAAFTWSQSQGFEDYGKTLAGVDYELKLNEKAAINAAAYITSRQNYEPRPFNILEDQIFGKGFRGQLIFDPGKWQLSSVLEIYSDKYQFKTYENLYEDYPGEGSLRGNQLDENNEIRSFLNYAVTARFPILQKLTMESGFNLNSTNFKFNDETEMKSFGLIFSPRISLVHEMTQEINFYATISHGFSPPSVEETLSEQGGFNTQIQPETGWNREFGMKGNHRWINYSIAVYSMDIRNLLVTRRTAEDVTFGLNAGSTRHDGLEAESEVLIFSEGKNQLAGRSSFSLNRYSFREFINDGQDFSGNRLTGVPVHQAFFSLDYTSEWMFAGVRYQFVGRMPITDANTIFADEYQLMDAYLGTQIQFGKWEIRSTFRINNLMDEKYASMLNINARAFGAGEPRYYYPGMPRNQQLNIDLIYKL